MTTRVAVIAIIIAQDPNSLVLSLVSYAWAGFAPAFGPVIVMSLWWKRMTRVLFPIQKASFISGYLLPFMTCLRELSLFMLLCGQGRIITTMLDYFDEMGLYAFSSGINLILILVILIFNTLVNKLTGASLDSGIGGG